MASDNITTADLNVPDLGEMVNTRASLASAFDRNPDQAAQARQLSQQTGSPMSAIEENLPEVSNQRKLDDYTRMLQSAPKTRQFFTRPDNAAVAHDNLPNMQSIERTFLDREMDIFRSDMPPMLKIGRMLQEVLPDAIRRGWYQGKQGSSNVLHSLGVFDNLQRQQDQVRAANGLPPAGSAERANYLATLQRQSDQFPVSDDVEQALQSVQAAPDYSTAAGVFLRHPAALGDVILQSIGATAPTLAMTAGSAVVGGPVGAAGATLLGSFATEYGASITGYMNDHNIDISDRVAVAQAMDNPQFMEGARTYALERGVPVAVFDALGAYLGGKFITGAKSTSLKSLAPRIAAEPVIQGSTGAFGEQAAQWVTGEDKPGDVVAEALAELPSSIVEIPGNYRHALRYAEQGEADAKRVETLNALAKADKVLQRDPALFQEFAQAASEDGPTNTVYISAGALMQSGKAQELAAVSPSVAEQLPKAQTSPDTLIAIPTDEYLTTIAPTDLAQPLVDHIKFDPNGFTRTEAADFKANHADEMAKEFARAIGNANQDEAFQASHDRLELKFRQELGALGNYLNVPNIEAVNKGYAKLLAAKFSVDAARRGVTPEEIHNEYAIRFARGEMQGGYEQSVLDFFGDKAPGALNGLSIAQNRIINRAFREGMDSGDWHEEEINPQDLIATQSEVNEDYRNAPDRYEAAQDKLPLVVRVNGKLYIKDGHHRAAAAAETGMVKARVIDVDSIAAQSQYQQSAFGNPTEHMTPLADGQTTIEVDGVERPTTNSNGQSIHWSEEGIRNFWRWFGDSKVVDAEGRPLVVYHGTDADFTEFNTDNNSRHGKGAWFSANENVASRWAESAYKGGQGARVMPAYLKASDPLIKDGGLQFSEKEIEGNFLSKLFGKSAHDSAFGMVDGKIATVVVRTPSQIKSATGNTGAFDPNNPNILMQSAVKEGRNAITGDLGRLAQDDPAAYQAVQNVLARMPESDRARLLFKLEENKGTPWAAVAVKSFLIREIFHLSENAAENMDQIQAIASGHVWGKENLLRYEMFKVFTATKNRGEKIKKFAEAYNFVTPNRKAEQDVSGSFLNCNPSPDCATNCYASLGQTAAPSALMRSEFTEYVARHHPEILAHSIARDYNISAPKKAGLALRINDKGDLSPEQVALIKTLNAEGIWLQVFSKRPELLRELDDRNLKMLSIDGSNFELARENPDMKLAVVLTEGVTEEVVGEFIDRTNVWFPVNLKGKEYTKGDIKAMYPKLFSKMSKRICPVEGTSLTAKPGVSFVDVIDKNHVGKGHWTCTTCDKLGTACFFNSATAEQGQQKAEQYVSVTSIGNVSKQKQIEKELTAAIEALSKLKSLGQINDEQFTGILNQLTGAIGESIADDVTGGSGADAEGNTAAGSGTAQGGTGTGGVNEGRGYNQPARGAFDPDTLTLAFLKDADYSTFIHETGHFFLEMDFDLASKIQKMADDLGIEYLNPGEQQKLRDVQAVLDWFGISDLNTWYSMPLEQKRPYHEKFARGFERYTMEGKAPSIELQSVFRQFKQWLFRIYKSLTGFNDVELTDEVRAVFDRMLASEEQIHLVQQARGLMPLLTSLDQAPMSADDFERFHKEHKDATDDAVEEFTSWALKDLKWLRGAQSRAIKELQSEAKDVRRDVRMQVKAEVMSQPVYRAWALLTGKITPQDKLPPSAVRKSDPNTVEPEIDNLATAIAKLGGLNKQELIEQWGIDPKENPKSGVFGKPVLRANGAGHSRETMAEMLIDLGYLSKDENGKHSLWEFEEKLDNQLRGMDQYSDAYQPVVDARNGSQVINPHALNAVRFDWGDLLSLISGTDAEVLKKRRMTRAEGGMHPDIVRDLILDENAQPVFASGEELANALVNATPPNEAIDALTDVRMLEEHGHLATPQAIAESADLAVHNKAMIKFATHQANILAQATGQRKVLEAAAKELADHEIGRTKIRYLRPSRYTSVEAKAAKSLADYLKANDIANAAAEARNQVYSAIAAKTALEAQAEVRKIDQFFKKIVSSKDDVVGKTRDMDIVNAARAVLYRFGYGHKARRADEYLKAVEKYDPELYLVLQQSIAVADALAVSAGKQGMASIRDLTVDQLRTLNEEVDLLWYQAKRGRQVEIDGKMVNREEVAERLADQANSLDRDRVEYGKNHAITPEENRALDIASARAILTRVEHWIDLMDDGQKMGAFRTFLFNRVKDAADQFRAANAKALRQYRDLFDSVAPTFKRELLAAPELGYTFGKDEGGVAMTELLHAILHTGNDSNKRKLLLGRNWAVERADGTLDTTNWDAFIARLIREGKLTKAHFDFAQGVWDLLESTKELAQKTHREVYGKYFAEVTATEFTTPWGVYRGGYVPATVDSRLVSDLEQKKLIEEGKDGMAYAFPSTNKGFTMSRVEYNKPLMLDLRTLPQHINKVLLFSHMEMPVRDVTRVLASKQVRAAVDPIDPKAINVMLLPWLNRSARQQVTTPIAGAAWVNRFANMVRGRTVMATMFANVTNAAQQITGFFPASLKVKPSLMTEAAAEYFKDSRKMVDDVAALSPFMAHRMDNEISAMMDDINEILLNPTLLEKAQDWSKRHSFFLQSAVDNVMSPIIWRAAFNQALAEEFDVKSAVRIADSVVRTTQGSSMPEDVSRFETGPAWARVLSLFSGWFLNLAGLLGAEFGKIMQQGGLRKNAGRAFMVFTLAFYAQAVVAEAVALAMRGGPDDDDKDGTYLDDWAKAIFVFGPLRTATAFVPVAGPAVWSAAARFTGNPNDDRISVSPVVNMLETVGAVPHDLYNMMVDKGNAKQTIRDVGTLITMGTGIAVAPAAKALGYAGGVAQGKIDPTGPVDVARGLVTGVPSPESKRR